MTNSLLEVKISFKKLQSLKNDIDREFSQVFESQQIIETSD